MDEKITTEASVVRGILAKMAYRILTEVTLA